MNLYRIEYRDSNRPDKAETVYAVAENEQDAFAAVDEKCGYWNARSIELIASEDENKLVIK